MDNVVVTAYIAYSFCMLEAKGGRRLAFLERLRAYGTAKLISERRNFVVVVGASVASIAAQYGRWKQRPGGRPKDPVVLPLVQLASASVLTVSLRGAATLKISNQIQGTLQKPFSILCLFYEPLPR